MRRVVKRKRPGSRRAKRRRQWSYTHLYAYFHPTATMHDDSVQKVVGKLRDGSGYLFSTGERDMEWGYRDRGAAERAAERLRYTFGRKMRVEVKTETDGPDDDKTVTNAQLFALKNLRFASPKKRRR